MYPSDMHLMNNPGVDVMEPDDRQALTSCLLTKKIDKQLLYSYYCLEQHWVSFIPAKGIKVDRWTESKGDEGG